MADTASLALMYKLIGMLVLGGGLAWSVARLTQGAGRLVGLLGLVAFELGMFYFPIFIMPLALILTAFLIFYHRSQRVQRKPYQSIRAVFEGGGIKRGLNPPEAALLLGKPFQVSLALTLVGMFKKGFVHINEETLSSILIDDRLKVGGQSLNAETRSQLRRDGAQALNQVVYPYEEPLLELLEQAQEKAMREISFEILVKPFVEEVVERIEGFDLKPTREYYRLIVVRAPKEARMDGELVKDFDKVFEKNLGWILLHNDSDKILNHSDIPYRPGWLPASAGSITEWFHHMLEDIGPIDYGKSVSITLGNVINPVAAALVSDIWSVEDHG